MPPSAADTTLVIGIDFGTTFSGVSWLICKTGTPPGQPEVISLWQTSTDNRRRNSDSQKVPSKMYYNEAGKLVWGFRTSPGAEAVEWSKLLLVKKGHLQTYLKGSSHFCDAKGSLQKLGKTPVQFVSEYLKALWDHAIEQIYNAQGHAVIDEMRFEIVLTVPAIWNYDARARMREAARLAGILKYRAAGRTALSFVSEPEAAAIATIPELETRGDLGVGDSFVIIDAGGGTVDIISYKVDELEPLSKFTNEYVDEGALCGGTFLDKEFESFLKRVIGAASWNKMDRSDIRGIMNNEWEHGIKRAFDGEPDRYRVEFPSRAQTKPLLFSSDELQPIFDKTVSQIGGLVNNQIRAIETKTSQLPKLVVLVGGFGRSPYILKYLKSMLSDRITVLQARGDKPWTAICRGAALSGAANLSLADGSGSPLVQSRVARSSYGWIHYLEFKEGLHDARDKWLHPTDKLWCAKNQMHWVIKRGEDISLMQAKTYGYQFSWGADIRGCQDITKDIYTCSDSNPPSRMQNSIQILASFTFRTPKPVEQFEMGIAEDSSRYRKWSFGLKVVVSGASFDLFLVSDGKEEKIYRTIVDVK
ncbi:hypothetical protein E0Z10_g8045 [Xylaria hypoxylon]|uniref:Uncharacterized protein n=1 Tax=Xylaria hypoxylon TaxID=37992 RepID=A0A4Z0YCE2_9PEZI|nr:hypothetical protein E0Z10_g8045 [Xylaria hypoxylon]